MLERLRDGKRILAIDPASRSLGYAVLEGPDPDTLVDWGLKETRNNKQKKSLALVNDQIDRYDPDLILAEDPVGKGSRRCPRIRKLITNILQLASKHKIKTKRYSRRAVKKAFFENARGNKHQIATAAARPKALDERGSEDGDVQCGGARNCVF